MRVTGDHVSVKFEKPYPEQLFREAMSYRVKGWFFIPAVKNGTWDGYKSLITRGKVSTGLYRAIKQELEQTGGITFDEHIVLSDPPPIVPGIKSDRLHQNECVEAMIKSLPLGGGTILAATSSGKTAVAAFFYSQVSGNHLFIVDQRKLLHQARADIANFLKEPVGIVGDGYFEPGRVTVATIQTLDGIDKWGVQAKQQRLMEYLGCLETTIVDEVHVQLSQRNFDVVGNLNPRARFGLTATLQLSEREVWLKVSAFSGPVIYTYPIERGIREGILSKVVYYQILFPPCVPQKELDANPGIDERWELVVTAPDKNAALKMLTRGYLKRNRYLVTLADRHDHIDYASRMLHEFNPMIITGLTKRNKADDYIDQFERGINRHIIASRVFNKGISIKRIDTIINIGETEDANTIVQQIGRELRLHEAKDGAIFVDFGTTTYRYGKAARARLEAVKAAGIPVRVFHWGRDREAFFAACKPASQMELPI